MTALVIRCTGREVDDALRPVGAVCGAVFPRRMRFVPQEFALPWPPAQEPVPDHDYISEARSAGWLAVQVGDALLVTCPACRRPSAAAVDLARSIRKGDRP